MNQVKDKLLTIPIYQWDENGYRNSYYMRGGYVIELRKDIMEWDPEEGDKLEIRTSMNHWSDVSGGLMDTTSDTQPTTAGGRTFWFDYPSGRMFLNLRIFSPKFNALRITYRYGSDPDDMPDAINRLCCLMVASQIVTSDIHSVKVGSGGDVSGIRNQLLQGWRDEMNQICTSYQRSGKVYSLYG